jgi:hypothetical protein
MVAGVFYGCKKDSSTVVNVTTADVAAVNSQLKGMWVFPVDDQQIVDLSGKSLGTLQYLPSPALQFDGSSKVIIYKDTKTTLNGTYTLSTKNGFIYLNLTYPDGTVINYQVTYVDSQTLKLVSAEPYVYYNNDNPEPATALSNVFLKKQSSADVTGSLINVVVTSDTIYSVTVSVTHTKAKAPGDTTALLDSKVNYTGIYSYTFPAQSGDQLTVDIAGDYTRTTFYAYYNGVPMWGNTGYLFEEIKTTTGWTVP